MLVDVQVTVLPGGWIDRKNAARALGRSPRTLEAWSRSGIGPTPRKVQGRVVYRWPDVQAFGAGEGAGDER